MSKRTMNEIQQEYTALCTKLGHLRYQIGVLEKDAEMIVSTLNDLNMEALALKNEAAPTPTKEVEKNA